MINSIHNDRSVTLTIYTQTKELTRTGKYKNVWTAKVGDKEIKALSLRMCKVLVSEAQDQMAMGNFTLLQA